MKIFFLCLFILILFLPTDSTGNEELFLKIGIGPLKGQKAPNFCLEDLNGQKVELKNFNGKAIFLNFWATWCGPCKEEMPSMEALWQQFRGEDFVLLGVSVDYEESKTVKEFVKKHRYNFPILLDSKCKVLDLYQVKGIPTTFLIDKRGKLIGKAIGPRDWKSPEVISLISILTKK